MKTLKDMRAQAATPLRTDLVMIPRQMTARVTLRAPSLNPNADLYEKFQSPRRWLAARKMHLLRVSQELRSEMLDANEPSSQCHKRPLHQTLAMRSSWSSSGPERRHCW